MGVPSSLKSVYWYSVENEFYLPTLDVNYIEYSTPKMKSSSNNYKSLRIVFRKLNKKLISFFFYKLYV